MNKIPFFITPVRLKIRFGSFLVPVTLYHKYEVFLFPGWYHTDIPVQTFNLN